LKVVQLVTRNCIGGVQGVARLLDEELRGSGHNSTIWYFCDGDEGIVLSGGASSLFKTRPRLTYYPRLLWRLWLRLCRDRPDAVIAHTTNTAVPGLLLAALAGIKKRIAVQHSPFDTYSPIAQWADRACANLKVYWRNVAVAQVVVRSITGYTEGAKRRLRVIHNGLKLPNTHRRASELEIKSARQRFNLPTEVALVVTVGRLTEVKNHAVLIEAMRSVDGAVLAIAGDGPLREELQQQIGRASAPVVLLGALSPEDVRSLLRAGDIFVTSSHYEAMNLAILEAAQEYLPIVASHIDAHLDVLGDDAILVEVTAERISHAIRILISDSELRARLVAGAGRRAAQFSARAMAEEYQKLVDESDSTPAIL